MMRWIRAHMRNPGFNILDWVGNSSLQWTDTADRNSMLLYWRWFLDVDRKFSDVPFSQDDFPHLFSLLSVSFYTLLFSKSMKLSNL
jgi:hypothetical protein